MCGVMWDVEHLQAAYWPYNRFEVKNENEDQDQSIPKSIGTLTVLRCIFGPNLESLTSFGIDLSPGQTHKPKMG